MTTTAPQTGYASVNGLELCHEVHGAGDPLILLHGGLGAVEMFGDVLPMLAKSQRVIVVVQAHGRTADMGRPLSYEDMVDDAAALIKQLAFERADVMGYSLGSVAPRTAIEGRWLERLRPVRRSARHPTRYDALRYLRLAPAGVYRHAVSGSAAAGEPVT